MIFSRARRAGLGRQVLAPLSMGFKRESNQPERAIDFPVWPRTVVKCWLMTILYRLLIWGCAGWLLAGCGRMITPTPNAPQPPTPTSVAAPVGPTATPRPTSTPRPATPIPTATPTVTPTPVIYVIQAGDTLLKIATQFNVSTEAVQEANGILDPRFLQIGQALIIPSAAQDAEAQPSPTPTPLPLDVEALNFLETKQGTLWCLGAVRNPGSVPLSEVVVEVSLFDANGVLLAQKAAYTQLDVLLPGSSAPFAMLFETPPQSFAQYQAVPVSGVPLTGDTRYYFDLEPFDLRGSPEGLATYRITGQLRNTGPVDTEAIRLVAVAYNNDNDVLAQRQANMAVNLLRAGAAAPFELELIIPAGIVDHFEVMAEGLQPE